MNSSADENYNEREQSAIKHLALRLYLQAATRILGASRDFRYIDSCAGPWKSAAADCSDTSFGIAIDVFRKARQELALRGRDAAFASLLVEKDPKKFARLDEFARLHDSPESRIAAKNWDFTEKIEAVSRFAVRRNAFPFFFIDPTGWQLAGMSKIKPLLRLNPGEVLINLMSSFIARFIKDGNTDFSDLLGDDFASLRSLKGPELEDAIVRNYCEFVRKEGGFRYVCALPVMNPDLDTFNFHLIYATRHPKGVQVFKDVEKKTIDFTHRIRADLQQRMRFQRTNNFELFTADVQYRETRYQRFASANRERARCAIRELFKLRTNVPYDDAWDEALQYASVFEEDLRAWLKEWELANEIVVNGKPARSRVLQRETGISLEARKALS